MPYGQPNDALIVQRCAGYSSSCPWCTEMIFEGDPIFLHDGDWICEPCHEEENVDG